MRLDKNLKVVLAKPRGFCAGVERAIEIVNRALELYGAPVYVRHEIVHNKFVVDDLKSKGVIFVRELDEVPTGGVTVFSAHGVSIKVEDDAKNRDLAVLDATCPLVKKVHIEAKRYETNGYELILIGHAGHPEVEGTSGRVENRVHLVQSVEDITSLEVKDPNKIAYVTQTTLSVNDTKEIIAALKSKFPNIEGPELKDICYATQNRQEAVRKLADTVDMIMVIGSHNSSNSNRLRDLAEEMGVKAVLINDEYDVDSSLFPNDMKSLGITAGASAPEVLLEKVIAKLAGLYTLELEEQIGIDENMIFKLPKELRRA
jgi:4-hydroxy-3-methylbut-2-enyl diphosphate reductase